MLLHARCKLVLRAQAHHHGIEVLNPPKERFGLLLGEHGESPRGRRHGAVRGLVILWEGRGREG